MAENNIPGHIARRRVKGGRRVRKRKRPVNAVQEIAAANRDDFEEESSGSDSDEWYEGDEHDEFAFGEGGYFKTRPGDCLNKRYVVRKRLGWGHFSQVYLAKDKETEKYVALKILKTGEDYVTAGEEERAYHEAINAIDVDSEKSHVCRMKDTFEVYSNRGKHICMVFERMSLSIYEMIEVEEEEAGFPVGVVRLIIKEVLQGIAELHAAGLVHTDLKPENLMLDCYDDVDEEECIRYKKLYDFRELEMELDKCKDKLEKGGLNKNQRKRVKARMSKLETRVSKEQGILTEEDNEKDQESLDLYNALNFLGQSVHGEDKANVKIVDLGTACWQTDKNDYEIGTRNYRAPECILQIRFTQAIDMWALGCMVVELLSGNVLFDPDEEDDCEGPEFDNEMRNSVHLKQIMEACGKIPKHMINREYFNRKNELLLVEQVEEKGLLELLREKVVSLEEEDLTELAEFLTPMLQIDPVKRATAEDMLKHEWLTLTKHDKADVMAWLEDLEDEEVDTDEDGET